MSLLFDLSDHAPLTSSPWDENRIRLGVADIVEGTRNALGPARFWPRSERDELLRACLDGWQGMPILDSLQE